MGISTSSPPTTVEAPGSFALEPLILGGIPTSGGSSITQRPVSVAATDIDGDGRVDIASANATNLTVFFQRSPGRFDSRPRVVGDVFTTYLPFALVAADIDGDGDQDLAPAIQGLPQFGTDVTVFWGGE